jgi:hypothetical protein
MQLQLLNALAKLRDSASAIRGQGNLLRDDAAKDLNIRLTTADISRLNGSNTDIAQCEAAAAALRRH